MRLRPISGAGLVDELQRTHRFTLTVLVSMLVFSLASSGFLVLFSQPRANGYTQLARDIRGVHEGMLDQDRGLRAWLATDDRRFLTAYEDGRRASATSVKQLMGDITTSTDVTETVVQLLLDRQRWEGWADEAADKEFTPQQRTDGTLTDFLLAGRSLFDTYAAAEAKGTAESRALRAGALATQTWSLAISLSMYLVLLVGAAVVTVRRRRRLRDSILTPIENLHGTVVAIRSGDLSARAQPSLVPELDEMGSALNGLAADLAKAGVQAASRESRLASLAYRFEMVVRVGREIAGSLSVRYVGASVTNAAAELLSTTAVLWLRGEDQTFHVVHRSQDPHGARPPSDLAPSALVAQSAAEAHPATDAGARAYPLVLAGQVTAVLEVATTSVEADTEQVLQALLSTAAVSLESAHLHSTAREQADLDGLTRLPNRRRFEVDVDTEWDRCRRYGRPLSLVMLDLDHFKRLNDEHGHLVGDQTLREVASVLTGLMRSTDTAYRYGGEELVVLLRETGLEDASAAAERIRAAVAALTFPEHPRATVTTSAGVATRHATMAHHTELVAEADQALYDAKRQGRDRVVTARAAGSNVLFLGDDKATMPSAPSLA